MAYGKEFVMNNLRKAGRGLADFDRMYAERAARDMGGVEKSPLRVMLGGTPLTAPSENDGTTRMGRLMNGAAIGGTYAVNAGYRYGLPAAGLTAAGIGLAEITNSLNQQTSGTLSPT